VNRCRTLKKTLKSQYKENQSSNNTIEPRKAVRPNSNANHKIIKHQVQEEYQIENEGSERAIPTLVHKNPMENPINQCMF
jgi:hypothetical protein